MAALPYRLHIFDGQYEVLADRRHIVILDLSLPGYGTILGQQLQALTRDALAANEPMDAPRLTVHDAGTDAYILDWTGV
ncbi:hypothetical protein [Micromonospora sp. HUAS LYJ1]|uniref:hypothetical protein n=1 Tax=Micromonospora sp. HUAS LYJ1 TaxID=3061626 RepID=UPI0026736EE1|nr:hypothetical protein [Micromonospora sp. HUAS LYJ1]WKU03768.1 hypothetical protein Q2K16_23430 [Micromonospora sp. HUAS LYJ1]